MNTLQDLIQPLNATVVGNAQCTVADVQFDSRKVAQGSAFVAVRGTHTDGHLYIGKAIAQGAVAVVCEELPAELVPHVAYVQVRDAAYALGIMASGYYGNPSHKMQLVGVTGTNGKTTTATLLYQLFSQMGHKVGLLSTVRYMIGSESFESTHTTPDALAINRLMAEMYEAGCTYCFMEVSSHSVVQQRIAGLRFAGGIFTNITHDHLDYHKTFKAYIEAKKAFFDQLPASAFALVNVDDKNGKIMLQNTRASKKYFGLKTMCDFKGHILEHDFAGMQLNINGHELWTYFIGQFNAYNLLGVYGAACLLGTPPDEALRLVSTLRPVEGRFEIIRGEHGKIAIVDYAHTPDALENVLETLREIRQGNQRILLVAGAGGDRDRTKRPEMAQVAARLADVVVLTSDNPRSENPEDILNDMEAGLTAAQKQALYRIADRRSAIRTALGLAQRGDVVLVAGKGHETYQEIQGVKHDFDDRLVVAQYINL